MALWSILSNHMYGILKVDSEHFMQTDLKQINEQMQSTLYGQIQSMQTQKQVITADAKHFIQTYAWSC